ncbi:MAG: hypothetical protein CMJ83_19975 [Planctomycetes bacterium]|nr:hypothetical protein [Planctomycetota bacterium]
MSDESLDPEELVDLISVSNPMIAQMIAARLNAEGILATVPGSDLKDEFAAFGQLIGLVGGTVRVPLGRLDDAKRVLEQAKAAGEDLEEALDASPPESDD